MKEQLLLNLILLKLPRNAYESDEYKEALKFSSQSADRHVVVVEAL